MRSFGMVDMKESSYKVRINNTGSIGRYYFFVKNPEALVILQARLNLGKLL